VSEPKDVQSSVHRCERCRRYFSVDLGADRGYAVKLWLCPPCYEQLLDEGKLGDRTALEGAPWSSRN
jgi:ribosomal protein L37AE/L43A